MKLIYGKEEFLVEEKFKDLLKDQNGDVSYFDETSTLDEIIFDVSAISLFAEKKTLVLRNCSAFTKAEEAKKLLRFVLRSQEDTHFIFIYTLKNTLPVNALFKYLRSNIEVFKYSEISERDIVRKIREVVREKGGRISNGASIKLAAKLPADLRIIFSEIDKLLYQDTTITEEMVEISASKYEKEEYFAFTNALIEKDVKAIIATYNQKKAKEEPVWIISQISTTLSLAVLVNSYRKQGMTNNEIATVTKVHVFRIKKAFELLEKTSVDRLEDLIISLSELDRKIKTGQIDPIHGLDSFILNYVY